MPRLVSFPGTSSPLPEAFADLSWKDGALELRFDLGDGADALFDGLFAASRKFSVQELKREDGLWKTTCFEAFFGVPGEPGYWELNLAANGAWNLYRFDGYRAPQPPAPSEDFVITRFEVGNGTLHCRLQPESRDPFALEAALCMVARTAQGTCYLSVKHAGAKPDFHLRASFTVKVPEPGAS